MRLLALLLVLASMVPPESTAAATDQPLPPAGGIFDYQIGGAYRPYPGTDVVSRDRKARPAPGLYSICYVNAFQTQPDEIDWWQERHPGLLLRDGSDLVVDGEWDEVLLDLATAAKREKIARIVGRWTSRCADKAFDAVEFDNLDSWTRSHGLLSIGDAKSLARRLNRVAAAAGLASGQKNTTQLTTVGPDLGFSFAVAEECNRYRECAAYTAAYGSHVYVIEYRRSDFERGCEAWPELAIVLRDRLVRPRSSAGHVHDAC
ncbi:MAG TPA: endo alpha-1,4 polygalactosaminidase [Acidimicrobiia bacterium]|jgi:hypothetical protein